MTKRAARKLAHRLAYQVLQQALDTGFSAMHGLGKDEQLLVERELDQMTQRHFNCSDLVEVPVD